MKFVILLFLAALSLISISAHVSVSPTQVPNSGTTLLTFNIGHSCATDALTYKMVFYFPPNITSIKPVYKAGWSVNYTSVSLGYKTPAGVDAFRLVFTFIANPGSEVPTWSVDTMLFRVTAPTGSAAWPVGSTFAIPVYQYCTGDLLDAWNSTTGGDSHAEGAALPAPAITILDPNDIQVTPSQSNVRALANQIAALSSSHSMTSDSSSWLRADTISVIAIILGGVGILASLVFVSRLHVIEKQNHILREKIQSQPSQAQASQEVTKTMDDSNKHTVSFHAQE